MKIVLSFSEFMSHDADTLKNFAKNNNIEEIKQKIEELMNFSMKLLKCYSSYQMKDITYSEFIKQILNGGNENNSKKNINPKAKEIIDNVFASMDLYKKNKTKYIDQIISDEQYFLKF